MSLEMQSEMSQARGDAGPDLGAVLADAAGEDQRVQSTQASGQRPNGCHDAPHEHRHCQSGALVVTDASRGQDLAHVR
jgi:hypothetical protein